LDLFHQRMRQAGAAQLGKIVNHRLLPRLLADYVLLATILHIDRLRLGSAVEKHQSMSAVAVDPVQLGRLRDGKIGGFERRREIADEKQLIGQAADSADVIGISAATGNNLASQIETLMVRGTRRIQVSLLQLPITNDMQCFAQRSEG